MNESDTRPDKIDPKLKQAGCGMVEGSRITTEYTFTRGKISQSQKAQPKRATTPIERKKRAERIKGYEADLSSAQKAFVEYLTNAYIQAGVDELGKDKLKTLLALKFGSVTEGISALGGTPQARQTFKDFQRRLYVG